jgi:hypothetical protein
VAARPRAAVDVSTDVLPENPYFSFVNRIVLLLGVEFEDGFEQTCRDDADERA